MRRVLATAESVPRPLLPGAALLAAAWIPLWTLAACQGDAPEASTIDEGVERAALDGESGYRALLASDPGGDPAAHASCIAATRSADPLLRNAAARALFDGGEPRAAEIWIANLDPRLPAIVSQDALHHLRAVFGEDRGYEPWLGRVPRRLAQREWWSWWSQQEAGRIRAEPVVSVEEAEAALARRSALREGLAEWASSAPSGGRDELGRVLHERALVLAASSDPEDLALARAAFEALIAEDPGRALLWLEFGRLARDAAEPARAEAAWSECARLDETSAAPLVELARLRAALGRSEAALEAANEAVRRSPQDGIARATLGEVLLRMGSKAAAERTLEEARRLVGDPWPVPNLLLARSRRELR